MNGTTAASGPTGLLRARTAHDPWLEQAPLVEEALAAEELKLVFVVGMPRSGTTWLQALLACQSAVGELRETHLFDDYLSGVRRAREKRAESQLTGLTRLLTVEGERRFWRAVVVRALLQGVPDWPSRRVLIEKTPTHVYHTRFILELLPEAYFVHVVRDPRAVAASWKAAGRTWAHDWARHGSIDLATKWTNSLRAGRRLASETDRYRLVRYEELHTGGPATLCGLFDWLGLDVTLATVEEYVARCRLERMRTPLWPNDFFRKGLVDGWREDLSRREIARIERVAGLPMEELGYPRSSQSRRPLPSIWLHQVSGQLERTSQRLVGKMRL